MDEATVCVSARFPVDEWVISFIMGLPGPVHILEPASMREAIRSRASQFLLNNQ
jgi:predicted DNA-binding transcriptional regulator YafY